MLNHIKRYPLSLLVIFTVIYLSFFRPPEIDDELPLFPGIDKMVHLCMYLGMSGMLWCEWCNDLGAVSAMSSVKL